MYLLCDLKEVPALSGPQIAHLSMGVFLTLYLMNKGGSLASLRDVQAHNTYQDQALPWASQAVSGHGPYPPTVFPFRLRHSSSALSCAVGMHTHSHSCGLSASQTFGLGGR